MMFAGSLTSCKHYPTDPPHHCDTCDTTHPPCDTCDTTHPPCDTCNRDKDSAAHAFIWTEYSIPNESSLSGAIVFDANNIFVLGSTLYSLNGGAWEKVGVGGGLADWFLYGFARNDYWIARGNIIFHGDESSLQEYRFTSGGIHLLNACWGISSNDMFFVGDSGIVVQYDGTTFKKMPQVTTKRLASVWGTSHTDVWAAGFDDATAESVLLHYDGSVWQEQNLSEIGNIGPFHHALGEVWATDSSGSKIVVASGSLLFRKTNNSLWRSDSGSIKNGFGDGTFIGLWHTQGNSINDFATAGDGGFISHWNGKTWKRYDELYNSGDPLYITNGLSMKGNTMCVVGKKNGTAWIAIGRRKPF